LQSNIGKSLSRQSVTAANNEVRYMHKMQRVSSHAAIYVCISWELTRIIAVIFVAVFLGRSWMS